MSEDTNSAPSGISEDAVVGETTTTTVQVSADVQPEKPTSVKIGTAESSDEPKQKIEITKVEKRPEEQLSVIMGRQSTAYWTEPSWPDPEKIVKSNNIVIRGDGIYELRKTPFAFLCVKKVEQKFVGFPKEDNPKGFFSIGTGKIPYSNLQRILHFFKDVCDKSHDEVYSQIFFNDKKGGCGQPGCGCLNGSDDGFGGIGLKGEIGYFVFIPEQKVSTGSVNFIRDNSINRSEKGLTGPGIEDRHMLPCEIHSHNTMGAFFSGTDDEWEKFDRFYGVVGELNKTRPAMSFSFVCGGKRQYIDAADLFTEAPEEKELFPQEWLKRVNKSYVSGGGSFPYSSSQAYGSNSSSGPGNYRFKPVRGSGSETRPYQGGTSTAPTGTTASRAEIQARIARAAIAAGDSDDVLRPVDILNESRTPPTTSRDSEVPGDNLFFPRGGDPVSGSVAQSPEYDERVTVLIGQIEETLMQANAKGIEMKDEEKREMFSSLVAALSEEDVGLFMEVAVDHGHVSALLDTVQSLGDQFDDIDALLGEKDEVEPIKEEVGHVG